MRYFEIAKPPARHVLADTDPKEAAGEPRSGQWRLGCANPSDRHCNFARAQNLPNRQSHRLHLLPLRSQ
jgi:hypothetical protein